MTTPSGEALEGAELRDYEVGTSEPTSYVLLATEALGDTAAPAGPVMITWAPPLVTGWKNDTTPAQDGPRWPVPHGSTSAQRGHPRDGVVFERLMFRDEFGVVVEREYRDADIARDVTA